MNKKSSRYARRKSSLLELTSKVCQFEGSRECDGSKQKKRSY